MSWIITSDQVSPPGDAAITYGITNAGGVFNLLSTGTVDYEAEWGDGNVEISTLTTLLHTYVAAGDYSVVVYSDGLYRPYLNGVAADATQITSVVIGADADLGTTVQSAWNGANNMTSFVCPFDVTSSVTSFISTWQDCTSLTSFPVIDTSSGTSFYNAWRGTFFTDFPSLDFSSGTNFNRAWFQSRVVDFPPNMFDTTGTLVNSAFTFAWIGGRLSAQSIENILVSLDTNGATGITLSIDGGTNAAKTTWSAAAVTAYDNLTGIVKGWTIYFNA